MNKALLTLLAALTALTACEEFEQHQREQAEAAAAKEAEARKLAVLRATYPPDPAFFRNSIGDEVFFASDSSVLTNKARARLREQGQWLGVNHEYNAVVEGYADERGPNGYNHPLAARRAEAVRSFLISLGIDHQRVVSAVTFGEENPARPCSSAQCLAENRRTRTVLVSADLL